VRRNLSYSNAVSGCLKGLFSHRISAGLKHDQYGSHLLKWTPRYGGNKPWSTLWRSTLWRASILPLFASGLTPSWWHPTNFERLICVRDSAGFCLPLFPIVECLCIGHPSYLRSSIFPIVFTPFYPAGSIELNNCSNAAESSEVVVFGLTY